MRSAYICDECTLRRDSISNEICPYRLANAGMLAACDRQDPKEACEHYKKKGAKECR